MKNIDFTDFYNVFLSGATILPLAFFAASKGKGSFRSAENYGAEGFSSCATKSRSCCSVVREMSDLWKKTERWRSFTSDRKDSNSTRLVTMLVDGLPPLLLEF